MNLKRFLERLPGRKSLPGGEAGDRLGQAIIESVRSASKESPDTSAQWMRLDRAIGASESAPLRPVRSLLPRVAFAGAAIIAVIAGLYLFRDHPSFEQFETARGEQLHVLLPDSSEVTLSHTTLLKFDRTDFLHSRAISLSGEAYFKVRRTGASFTVATDNATIVVVGTEFNVRARNETYEVGVTEGVVSVSTLGAGPISPLLLHKGELIAGVRGGSPGLPQPLDANGYPGWTHGRLFVERMTVETICREIEDRFNVSIEVRDSRLLSGTLSGVIIGNDAKSMVSTLSQLLGRNYRSAESAYTIY
jgi:transmembrane sensor